QSTFTIDSESNSTADADGLITVHPGDRIPLIPRNTGRLAVDYDYLKQWDIGATIVVASSSYLHGDENNANVAGGANGEGATVNPGGTGTGQIPSYLVVNLNATYYLGKNVDLFARVVNVFNKEYS